MNYEKKYRDLVEAVKELQEANPSDEGIQKWVEDNVPELTESEDKRIRKELLAWLKSRDGQTLPIDRYNAAIDWLEKQGNLVKYYEDKLDKCACDYFNKGYKKALEKQGEHAKFRDSIQVGDKVTRNQDGVLVNLSQLNRVAKKDENQGEQKPVKKEDWCFEKGKWYVKLCHDYEGDLRHFQEGHVYQAVSETSITDGYHHVSLNSWQIPKYFRPATKEEIPQELKPVEPQQDMLSQEQYVKAVDECVYGEQKPAEWSEEDEMQLDAAIHLVSNTGHIETANWLKSLKDRYTWKPSEEQMAALNNAILLNEDHYNGAVLSTLREQLKKLREE